MNRRRPRLHVLGAILALAGTLAACGLRTPVRPPEETAPIVPGVVTATRGKDVIVVRWKRADRSADGMRLDDLVAFVVERKRPGEEAWQRVATIDVIDQEKIRRRRDFSWRDAETTGDAAYRVMAVNADGQEGPSNEAGSVTQKQPNEGQTTPVP